MDQMHGTTMLLALIWCVYDHSVLVFKVNVTYLEALVLVVGIGVVREAPGRCRRPPEYFLGKGDAVWQIVNMREIGDRKTIGTEKRVKFSLSFLHRVGVKNHGHQKPLDGSGRCVGSRPERGTGD